MTEKLYYKDSELYCFNATVLTCEKIEGAFLVTLDKTAFFPEGGGQKSDTGKIGDSYVFDVREINGEIIHFCKASLEAGKSFECSVDKERRFSFMQNHSGEHIVSGVVHSLFGFDNVGFHMDDDCVTVDFNGELSKDDLKEVEKRANEAVWSNIPFEVLYPSEAELKKLNYRSKLDLTENVRLVKIGDIDLCACCAPHVKRSGEIGAIKLSDFSRHRGGTRVTMRSGKLALCDYSQKYESVHAISNLLSVKQNEADSAVQKLLEGFNNAKKELYDFKMRLVKDDVNNAVKKSDMPVFITSVYDGEMLKEFVDSATKCGARLCAAFSGENGVYSYAVLSREFDMKAFALEMNTALNGRGGGRDGMIQGRVPAEKEEIIEFFNRKLGEIY